MPLAETPPVSGPMNPTLTLSFAGAATALATSNAAVTTATVLLVIWFSQKAQPRIAPKRLPEMYRRGGILTPRRPSCKQAGMPQPQRLHEKHRLHVVESSGIRLCGEIAETELHRRRVLMFAGEPPARPGTVGLTADLKIEMHALGGDARHRPYGSDMLQRVELQARLLPSLAAPAFLRIAALDDAGDSFERLLLLRRQEHRRAELAHQNGGAALRVVRQHANGRPVILDLTPHGAAIGEADGQDQELAAARMKRVGADDLKRHFSCPDSLPMGDALAGPFFAIGSRAIAILELHWTARDRLRWRNGES